MDLTLNVLALRPLQRTHGQGIKLLNALYHSGDMSIAVAFAVIGQSIQFSEIATRKVKRTSEVTKNERMRQMIGPCIQNQLTFRYVLMDSWFSAKENFAYIVNKNKHFVAALKDNRRFSLSLDDKKPGRFISVSELALSDKQAVRG